jgi:hypothetical protein
MATTKGIDLPTGELRPTPCEPLVLAVSIPDTRLQDMAEHSKIVSYLRVSTDKRGRNGLGIEAQRDAVTCSRIARMQSR